MRTDVPGVSQVFTGTELVHAARVPFRDFMAADTEWFHHSDFINQFASLTSGSETMTYEAAFTKPGFNPGFINVATFGEDGVQITVRGEPSGGQNGDAQPGGWARLHISLEDWQQLEADVRRLPFPGNEAPTQGMQPEEGAHPYTGEPKPIEPAEAPLADTCSIVVDLTQEMNDAVEAGAANGASVGDPLGMRADTYSEAELQRAADDSHRAKVAESDEDLRAPGDS